MAPGLTRTGHDADFSSLASQELQQGAGRFTAIGVVTADITLAAAVLYVIIDVDDENAFIDQGIDGLSNSRIVDGADDETAHVDGLQLVNECQLSLYVVAFHAAHGQLHTVNLITAFCRFDTADDFIEKGIAL